MVCFWKHNCQIVGVFQTWINHFFDTKWAIWSKWLISLSHTHTDLVFLTGLHITHPLASNTHSHHPLIWLVFTPTWPQEDQLPSDNSWLIQFMCWINGLVWWFWCRISVGTQDLMLEGSVWKNNILSLTIWYQSAWWMILISLKTYQVKASSNHFIPFMTHLLNSVVQFSSTLSFTTIQDITRGTQQFRFLLCYAILV